MRTHAIARTHTRPMRERGAAKAIFNDRGRVLVLIFAFLLIYREPASECFHGKSYGSSPTDCKFPTN